MTYFTLSNDISLLTSFRYVIIIILCDSFETKGLGKKITCPAGYFGAVCINKCPLACNGTCDPTGKCYHCSKFGFRLPYCDQPCMHGSYGLHCLNRCSDKCLDEKCDPETGHCYDCREIGVSLPNCTDRCKEGTYGINCENHCPDMCKKSCNSVNGTCNRCWPGRGQHCTVNCAIEKDKEMCALYCPSQCLTWCNTTDSHCALCSPGYNAPFCNTTCQAGRYGHNCKQICSDLCKHGKCDPITGSCFSCTDGYVGQKCNGQCIQGFYGPECDLNCPETCLNGSCDFVNGTCFKCQDGYKGLHCDELCTSGKYGKNCIQDCSKNCLNTCDPVSGACWQCIPGYKETFCNVTCQQGTYGDGCNQMCPTECRCDHVTGKCIKCTDLSIGPDCTLINTKQETSRNIMELSLYVSVSLLGVVVFVSCIMCWYKKHINVYWTKTTEWLQSKVSLDQLTSSSGKSNEITCVNMYQNEGEENISSTNIAERDAIKRHRNLVGYLRSHGKSYTPKEYNKTELRVQYLKQIQTTPVLGMASEQYDQDERDSVNISISHATIVKSKHQAADIYRQSYDNKKQCLATTLNSGYIFSENKITSLTTENKIKPAGEQIHLKSQYDKSKFDRLSENNRSQDDHCIIKSTDMCLISGITKPVLAATVTYTSETKSKLSDSFLFAKNNPLFVHRDGDSADSLYGITSQEFLQDQLNSEDRKCSVIKHLHLFPFENYDQTCIRNAQSEQSISNDQSIACKKKAANKIPKSQSIFDSFLDKSQELHNTCVGDKLTGIQTASIREKSSQSKCLAIPSICSVNNTKFVDESLTMTCSKTLDDASSSTDQETNILETSALKVSRDQKQKTIESHTDSTSSAGEQESFVEEYSSLTQFLELPTYLLLDQPSASTRKDTELQKVSETPVRGNHKTTSSRLKKYRKFSPPKSLHGAIILFKDSQTSENQEANRPTCSQIDIKSVRKQSSVARVSTSVVIKTDSPRLVRCGTTRQLSPMYTTRTATVNRLTPLPTPPPEGRMNLKPVSKLSSSSSVLEQTEDEKSLQL